MRRLVAISALAALLIGFCLSHTALSVPPPGKKQLICHIDKATGTGKVIEVAKSAIAAHCKHGDFTRVAVPTTIPPTPPVTLVKGAACGAGLPTGATRTCAVAP